MANIQLHQTKQGNQIAQLHTQLEKRGWIIVEELERTFNGKPRWEIGDTIPNLIYSWRISRNGQPSIWLDFISQFDQITYETLINQCDYCQIRGQKPKLSFVKDKALKRERVQLAFSHALIKFIDQIP